MLPISDMGPLCLIISNLNHKNETKRRNESAEKRRYNCYTDYR